MTTRYDVTSVPVQGGYVAKQCPVRAQNDAIHPAEPEMVSAFTQRLFDHGNAFEADVLAEVVRLHPDSVLIDAPDSAAREDATAAAMAAGATPILGARLPADPVGRRVGRPDLLVASPTGGYRPVDIKWHQNLEVSTGGASQLPGLCSDLSTLAQERATVDADFAARKREGDLMQLAHYQRMLETLGLAAPGARLGGIIGTERRVVWYDLDAPIWKTPSSTGKPKLRSTMERYDFEFDFRLDIIAVAEQHTRHPDVDLLVVPVRCSECPSCPWNEYCGSILAAGTGDVSLLPRIGWAQWKIHRDHGVTDRAALAALDWKTACAVAAGVDVAELQLVAAARPSGTSVLDLDEVWDAPQQLRELEGMGVATVGDLLALDRTTATYSRSGLAQLPEHIDQARAALGGAAAYRRRGVEHLVVPRADIEVDVDMENTELGVYLWGALLTDCATSGEPYVEYLAFHTWQPLTAEIEAENSLRFWRWLTDVRAAAHARNLSFRAYCYNESAENQYLRRLGLSAGLVDEIAGFIASDEWVDMLKIWDSQLLTGTSSGLKVVAGRIGHAWDIVDPGGGESIVWYDAAVAGDEEARRWLLTYNRGDVEATHALREWMSTADVPAIDDVLPTPATYVGLSTAQSETRPALA